MNKKVLVTGANGQLGKTFKELYSSNLQGLDFIFVSKSALDITNQNRLSVFFSKNIFDYCINCAAYTDVEQAEKSPEVAYRINSDGVRNLAKVCKEKNIILIHISTDYVFDGEKAKPYTVFDVPNPINEYGKSKLLGEKYIQNILSSYYIVRTSWLYSKKYGHNFYKSILNKAKKEKVLSVTDDQVGCPTNTVDLSLFIVNLAIQAPQAFGIYHFCGSEILTWYDFARQILSENQLVNKTKLVKVSNYVNFAQRPKYTVLKNI